MIRSKIFYKAMVMVSAIILTYTFALLLIVLPQVEKSTRSLEEKNGKEVLSKVSLLARNMQLDLEDFKKHALRNHKTTRKNLTDTFWSIEDIHKEVAKRKNELIEQLHQVMNQTTIDKSGYLFIVDDQARMVIHPNADMEGQDTTHMENPATGNNIFADLKLAAETGEPLYFKWDRPTDKDNNIYDKIAWVEFIPELNWYITSSFYVSELQATSRQLKNIILLLGLSILLFAFLVSFLFFKNLLKPISTLSTLAGRVTEGDYSGRSHVQSHDEIGVLSREFNTMVDTIEDNINNLDQKVAEKTRQIEKQNTTFATLFYESSDGILLIQDGLFIDCNKSAYQMLKYGSKGKLTALHPSVISPEKQPDGRSSSEKADEMIQIALDRGTNRFEWVHLCKDGSETFLEIVLTRVIIQDEVILHVVWRDINAKKVAERLLQKTVNEFSAVMDAIDYGVLFMDDQLHVRIANQAFRDIWGISADFVSRHPTMRELMAFNRYNNLYPIADEDFDQYMDAREQDVHSGAIAPTLLKRNDGIILQYQCIVLPDNWRMLTYFDLTELKNTQDQLSRAQKMEAIGMMAGGVAHDLNNILSGIVSYPELLLLQLPEDSKLRKPLEEILDSGKRAATVVADLLTVARGAASTREPHDLNILIHEYLCSPEWRKLQSLHPGVRCTEQLDAKQSFISCSPVHIKKTAMNLIGNAMEAVAVQGEVRIATLNLEIADDDRMEHDLPAGRYIVFTVQDSGPGISSEDLDHIFEPFYSRKVMGRSGTGLGLTVVWNTVQEHDARIRVKSNEQGTLFTLYFPLSAGKIRPEKESRPARLTTTRGEHILIVDDEPQLRDIAGQILTAQGYSVSTAASGEEAITFIRKHPVDLLVIDMLMDPGINGRRTYERILAFNPEQKALIASGFSESDDVKATLELGARGFIKKPYSIYQLAGAVKEALEAG
jgi:PAS domain S-box-containing protein